MVLMYSSTRVTLSSKERSSPKSSPNCFLTIVSLPRYIETLYEMYLSNLNIGRYRVGLLELLKESITVSSPTLISSDSFALSSIATDYDFDTYRRFTQSRSKAFSKLTGKPFKYSRKTFRTKASVVANVSTEIGNALLGQENANISANYLSMEELSDQVNKAHSAVIEDFNVDGLYFQLLRKTATGELRR